MGLRGSAPLRKLVQDNFLFLKYEEGENKGNDFFKYQHLNVDGTLAKGVQLSLRNTTLDVDLLDREVMRNDDDSCCLWRLLSFHLNRLPPKCKNIFWTVKAKKDINKDGVGLHFNRVMGASTIGNMNRNLMVKIGIDKEKAKKMTNQGNRKLLATKIGGVTYLSGKGKASCLGHASIQTSEGFYQCAKNHKVKADIQKAIAPVPFASPPIVQHPYHRTSLVSFKILFIIFGIFLASTSQSFHLSFKWDKL